MTLYLTSAADGCNWSVLYSVLHNRCSITFAQLCEILKDFCSVLSLYVGRVAQSTQRLTTGWTVRDRIPVGTRFSARPDRPWGPPCLLYNGYRVLTGGKVRPGRAADHSPPSSAAVMEEQSYTCTHPLGHIGAVTGNLYLYLFFSQSLYLLHFL